MKNFIFAMIALIVILAAVDICRSPHEDPSASPPTEMKQKEELKNNPLPAADRRADAPCVNPEGFRNRMPDGVPEREGKPLKNIAVAALSTVNKLTTTTIPYFFYSSTYGLWCICRPQLGHF